jgi:hypothetical protein
MLSESFEETISSLLCSIDISLYANIKVKKKTKTSFRAAKRESQVWICNPRTFQTSFRNIQHPFCPLHRD